MTTSTSFPVGPRVKYAREQLRMTQDALAQALGFKDRQTVSDIENGKRAVKTDELLRLGEVLDQEVAFFLDPFNVVAEAEYAWHAGDDVPAEELGRFQLRAGGWVGMLRWLLAQEGGAQPEYGFVGLRLNEGSTCELARSVGERLADFLGLGPVPANNLPACLETQLGIPVLFVDARVGQQQYAISGAACRVGPLSVILANRRESPGQRNLEIAHALFRALTWDAMPPNPRSSSAMARRGKVTRVGQLAGEFAGALLMPRSSLERFLEPARLADVQHLADVAATLQVTTQALGSRLSSLGRIDEATRASLADVPQPEALALPALFSPMFVRQLHVALDKGRVSARKAAKTVDMPLFELTELFHAHGMPAPFAL